MSITVTISGNKSELDSYFQPPLSLSGQYECGLLYCSVINSTSKYSHVDSKFPSVIRIECDLIYGSYCNGLPTHIIHEFVSKTAADNQYIEIPQNVIYFPVNKNNITSITIKVLDQFGYRINFKEQYIEIRLHLRKVK